MPEPTPVPEAATPSAPSGAATSAPSGATPSTSEGAVGIPAQVAPRLLVMPETTGFPSIEWPGRTDQPAWAIPVTIPSGTRGYAVFLPLLPGAAEPATGTDTPAAPADTAVPAPRAITPTEAAATAPTDTTPPTNGTAPTGPATTSPATTGPATDGAAESGRATSPSAGNGTAPAPPPTNGTAQAPPAGNGTAQQPPPNWPVYPGGPRPPHGVPYASAASPYSFRSQPPQPSFIRTIWPGPKAAIGWRIPAAVLAGGLGVAAFVPLNRTGIGWFLGWLVLTAAVVVAVRQRVAERPRAEQAVRAGWAAAALALLAVLAFRNAWWLVTFCVLGALGCAALAIVGGRLIRSILFSLVAAPLAAFRGLPWVRRHVEGPADTGTVRRVVGSVVATMVVLLVFGALLSSADAAFSLVLGQVIPEVSVPATFRGMFLLAVGGLIAVAAVYTITAPPDLSRVDRPTTRRLGIVEWAPPIAALTALFVGFVAVQFTVLFGGERHVLRTAGLSYAEYARSGFWQLVAVTLLTLAVLGGVTRWAQRESRMERILLRVMLGLLSTLGIVIVVSALSRMYTYQKVYSFTGERIFVMAFELLLGAVFLMVIAAGVRWRGQWIPPLTVALAVVMLLSLAVLNPEDYAARRNIARYEQTGKIDAWYLRALSADATPALSTLPDPVRRCTLSWIADDLAQSDPWYAWNLGRTRAREALDRVGPGAVGGPSDCRAADQYDLPKTRR
ncbi:DUF4153 domain-containing protein [Micromonospora sp. BQ11]|uniref:DUF4153 domain-containing protein n=1 Tax=Micromonospora sp. BQ11 TaxID=3452212 RepID=UPI003F88D869